MIEKIIQTDQEIFLWLNQNLRIFWLDKPMFLLSETWVWIPFYLFLLILLFNIEKKKILLTVFFIVLLVISTDGLTSWVMKPFFKRPRPTHEISLQKEVKTVKDWQGQEYRGGQFGFASSHAANAFGVAMFFWLSLKKRHKTAYFLFLWAFLVAYTRIYLGVHYPLDIIVGAGIGIFFGIIWRYFATISHQYFFEN